MSQTDDNIPEDAAPDDQPPPPEEPQLNLWKDDETAPAPDLNLWKDDETGSPPEEERGFDLLRGENAAPEEENLEAQAFERPRYREELAAPGERAEEEPAEEPKPEKPKKKKSLIGRLVKGMALFVLSLVILLAGAGAAVNYFFPPETLRPIAERELSNALKLPVAIGELEIGILHGIEIKKAQVGAAGKPLLTVRSLVLDYDLTKLLTGQLVVNKIIVDQPALNLVSTHGAWNFQTMLGPAQKPKPAPKKEGAAGLPLPLMVDLKHFAINNVKVDVNIDDQTLAHAEGLNVQAQAQASADDLSLTATVAMAPPKPPASPHNMTFSSQAGKNADVKTALQFNFKIVARDLSHADVTGKFQLSDNQVKIGKPLASPPVGGEWDVAVSLKPEQLKIRRLLLNAGKDNQVELSGEVQNFLDRPDFKLTLLSAAFNIQELLGWAGDSAKSVRAKGILRVSGLEATGKMPHFQPESIEIKRGNVALEEFSASHAPSSASVEGAKASLSLQDVKLQNMVPQSFGLEARLTAAKARAGNLSFSNLVQQARISAEGANLESSKIGFSVAADDAEFRHPKLGKTHSALRLEGDIEGNLATGDLSVTKVALGAGPLLDASLQGKIKDFGRGEVLLDQSLNLNLGHLKKILPEEIAKKSGLSQLGGTAKIDSRVQARLDKNFKPQTASIKANLALKGVDLQTANPSVSVKNLNLQTVLPLEYGATTGVKASSIDVNARFQKLDALGNWEVGAGEASAHLTMAKPYLMGHASGLIPITNRSVFKAETVRSGSPVLKISGLALETDLRSDLFTAQNDVRNITLAGALSFKALEGLQKIKTGKSRTDFTVDAHDRSLAKTRATVKTSVLAPSLKNGGMTLNFGEMKLDSLARLDLKNGDVDVDSARLELPGLLSLDAKAQARKWGETFAFESKASQMQVNALLKSLPESIAAGVKGLQAAGTASMSLSASGSKPSEADLKNLNLPVSARGAFALNRVTATIPERRIKVEDLNYSGEIDLKNNDLKMTGKLSIGKAFKKDLLGESWLEPEFAFRYALDGWNKLVVEKHEITIKNRGISHTVAGRVEGLKAFLLKKASWSPAEIGKRVDAALTASTRLKMDQATPLTRNLKTEGALSSRMTATLAAGKEIVLDGEVGFDRFNAFVESSVKIKEIDGKFLFNKKLLLDKNGAPAAPETFRVAQKGFFNQLRDFSKYKNILRVASAEYGAYKASNIGIDLFYKDNWLAAEKFLMDVLRGSVAGQLFLVQTQQGPVLNFSTEFAGLDFNELLGEKAAGGNGKSQIDGNMQLGFKATQESGDEKISLDQITAKIAITRIGDDAMDRLLLYLDPEESKPSIVDTRSKLKLASPHRILIALENGNLSVEIWLKSDLLGGIIKAPELKRVPVSSLKRFKTISDQVQALAGLRNVLQYLAARGIAFDENGKISTF